jgi:outer membrane protein assembly factor BamB
MRSLGKVICAGLLAAALGGCAAGNGGEGWKSVVAPDVLATASLEYAWRNTVDLDEGETVRNVWRVDEVLYCLTSGHHLVAMDAVSGVRLWTVQVGDVREQVFPPCHADNVAIPPTMGIHTLNNPPDKTKLIPFKAVMINTSSELYVIDRATGKVMRKHELKFAANTGGATDGVHYFVASVSGDIKGGSWYYSVDVADGLTRWVMRAEDLITARPVYLDNRLYIASADHKLYCVNPDQARKRVTWESATEGPIVADFVVDTRGCFVPSEDYKLYAIDRASGVGLWSFRTGGPLTAATQVGQQTVYQFAKNDRFYAVDLATGAKRWDNPDARTVLADLGDRLAVLSAQRNLLIVNEVLGKVELSIPLTGLDLFVPNAAKAVIYAVSAEGKAVCIRPAKAPPLTASMLKEEAAPALK